MALDENTVAPRGVIYIDENQEPLLASRAEEKCALFPNSIEPYDGPDAGFDIRGSRKKEAEKAAVEAVKAKTRKKKDEVVEDAEVSEEPKKKKIRK